MRFIKILSLVFFYMLCFCGTIYGQAEESEVLDSLKGKSYRYLYHQYKKNVEDTMSSVMYLTAFLDKAILENNKINQSIALNDLSYYAKNREDKFHLIKQSLYESNSVDSLSSIPAYNNLGQYYQDYYDHNLAIDQFLKVYQLSKKANDKEYEGLALTNIANVKSDIGNHKEALVLYKKCFDLKKSQGIAITSISLSLAQSFMFNKEHDSATYYYNLVIDKIREESPYYLSLADINEGINLYHKGDRTQSKLLLEKGSSLIERKYLNSLYYLKYYIRATYYLGKINEPIDKELAMSYYEKVDSLQTRTTIILPEIRDTYMLLKGYYEKENKYSKHLYAINKLLEFDSIVSVKNITTTNKLNAEFDTPELLKEKEKLILQLENKNKNLSLKFVYLVLFIIIILALLIFQFRRNKVYKKRFEAILIDLDNTPKAPIKVDPSKTDQQLHIDPKVVATVLDKLEVFESKNGFLKKTVTVTSLARKLATNTKYLSKIINTYKGKSFISYINDLRIEYILKELQINTVLQRYTILGIAKEIGFNSADSFSSAFKKKTGISPSFYIKKIKNTKKETITH